MSRQGRVVSLWRVLYLLKITEVVAITTLAAIFDPEALRAGLDRFSSTPE